MARPKGQFEIMEVFAKWALIIISTVFTCSLMIHIVPEFGERGTIIMAAFIAVAINCLELLAFFYGKRRDSYPLKLLGAGVAIISITSSLGFLQIGVERGTMESQVYQAKLLEVETIQNQLRTYNKTADKQTDINHLKQSRETLRQSTPLLSQLDRAQQELNSIKASGAGFGTAIYKFYAKIFKTSDVAAIALWVNLFIALMIEMGAIWLNIKDVQPINKPEKTNKRSPETADTERKKKRYKIRLSNGNTIYVTKEDYEELFNGDNGKVPKSNIFGFQVNDIDGENRSLNLPDNNDRVNEKIVHVNDFSSKKSFTKSSKNRSLKRGKSDHLILNYYDNWNVHSNGQFSYGKLSKVLKNAGVQVGKTYCYNVIKRERLG